MSKSNSTIPAGDFVALKQTQSNVPVVDVRTAAEVSNEYLDGSIHLPLAELNVEKLSDCLQDCGCDEQDSVYILCGSGLRAQKAVEQLRDDVTNPLIVVDGGIAAMKNHGVNLSKGAGNVISLERQVRIASGLLIVLGSVLGALVSPVFYGLPVFVGAGLVFSGLTDTCGMGLMLARMPWNNTG